MNIKAYFLKFMMQVRVMIRKVIFSRYYCFILILLSFTSCHNGNYPVTDVFYNQKGDTSSITVDEFLGDGLYKSTIYEYETGNKLKKEEVQHLLNGIPHDTSMFYHSNGKLKSIIIFNKGKIWEVEEYFDSKGNRLDFGRISKGEGYLKEFYSDIDILKEEGKIVDGYKEGYWIQYCGDGKRICDSTFYDKSKNQIMKEIEEVGIPVHQTYK